MKEKVIYLMVAIVVGVVELLILSHNIKENYRTTFLWILIGTGIMLIGVFILIPLISNIFKVIFNFISYFFKN